MPTQEIPQEQWQTFFDDFSQLHRNWETEIEILGRDLGDQPEAEGAPLQGISFELAGSEAGDLEIALGDTPDAFQTHRIEKPQRVRVVDSQPGAETDIEVDSAAGYTAIMRFRPYSELPQ